MYNLYWYLCTCNHSRRGLLVVTCLGSIVCLCLLWNVFSSWWIFIRECWNECSCRSRIKPMEFSSCVWFEFKAFFLYDILCVTTYPARDMFCVSFAIHYNAHYVLWMCRAGWIFHSVHVQGVPQIKAMEFSSCKWSELNAFFLYECLCVLTHSARDLFHSPFRDAI